MGCWKNFNEYCDGNLIKNAIESIGTEKGEINVDYVNEDKNLIVTIQDSGPEISNLEKTI